MDLLAFACGVILIIFSLVHIHIHSAQDRKSLLNVHRRGEDRDGETFLPQMQHARQLLTREDVSIRPVERGKISISGSRARRVKPVRSGLERGDVAVPEGTDARLGCERSRKLKLPR